MSSWTVEQPPKPVRRKRKAPGKTSRSQPPWQPGSASFVFYFRTSESSSSSGTINVHVRVVMMMMMMMIVLFFLVEQIETIPELNNSLVEVGMRERKGVYFEHTFPDFCFFQWFANQQSQAGITLPTKPNTQDHQPLPFQQERVLAGWYTTFGLGRFRPFRQGFSRVYAVQARVLI